jgi:hypothetical protein
MYSHLVLRRGTRRVAIDDGQHVLATDERSRISAALTAGPPRTRSIRRRSRRVGPATSTTRSSRAKPGSASSETRVLSYSVPQRAARNFGSSYEFLPNTRYQLGKAGLVDSVPVTFISSVSRCRLHARRRQRRHGHQDRPRTRRRQDPRDQRPPRSLGKVAFEQAFLLSHKRGFVGF